MEYKFATNSMTPPPPDNPPHNKVEYVDLTELKEQLNKLLNWCSIQIGNAKELLIDIDDIMKNLAPESEEYNKFKSLKELINEHLNRTFDDNSLNATEIYYLVSEQLEELDGKEKISKYEHDRIEKQLRIWNGHRVFHSNNLEKINISVEETIQEYNENEANIKNNEAIKMIKVFLEEAKEKYQKELGMNPKLNAIYSLLMRDSYKFMGNLDPKSVKERIDLFYEEAQKLRNENTKKESIISNKYKDLRTKIYNLIEKVGKLSYDMKSEDLLKIRMIDSLLDNFDRISKTSNNLSFLEDFLNDIEKKENETIKEIESHLPKEEKENPITPQLENNNQEIPVQYETKKNYENEIIQYNKKNLFLGKRYLNPKVARLGLFYEVISTYDLKQFTEEDFEEFKSAYDAARRLGVGLTEERKKHYSEIVEQYKQKIAATKPRKKPNYRSLVIKNITTTMSTEEKWRLDLCELVRFVIEDTKDEDWSTDLYNAFNTLFNQVLIMPRFTAEIDQQIEGFKNHFKQDVNQIEK